MFFALLMLILVQDPFLDQYVAAQKAFASNPRSEDRLVALANILFQKEQTERAIALVAPFVKANPNASRAKLLLASAYIHEEKYDLALTLARQVAQKLPKDYYAQHVAALALVGLNRLDEGETGFKQAIELKPDFAESHFRIGLLYARKSETLQQAYASFQRAMDLGYPKPEIYKNLGSIDIKLGHYGEAIEQLNTAIRLNPNYADAHFLLADAFRKSGAADQAAEATKRFQSLNAVVADRRARANKSQALYEEGMALLFASDRSFQPRNFARAYESFRRAAEELPELDAAYYRLAQIDFLRNNGRRAIENIRRAVELNPFEPEYYFVLASGLRDVDVSGAIEAATKAISLDPRAADFHNLLGILLEKAGDHSRAIQSYRKATELAPADEVFKNNLDAALRRIPRQFR